MQIPGPSPLQQKLLACALHRCLTSPQVLLVHTKKSWGTSAIEQTSNYSMKMVLSQNFSPLADCLQASLSEEIAPGYSIKNYLVKGVSLIIISFLLYCKVLNQTNKQKSYSSFMNHQYFYLQMVLFLQRGKFALIW